MELTVHGIARQKNEYCIKTNKLETVISAVRQAEKDNPKTKQSKMNKSAVDT